MSEIELPPCPRCGSELRIVMRLEATDGLLSGSQPKVSVREWPWIECSSCGLDARGKQ